MNNRLNLEFDELCGLLADAKLGWWKADFNRNLCFLSEYISNLLGMDGCEINIDGFIRMVREDYRTRIRKEFNSLMFLDCYDQTFPIYTKEGIVWVHSKLCRKEGNEESGFIVSGIMQRVADPEEKSHDQAYIQRINNLFYQQNSISYSLLSILRTEDTDGVINGILGDILREFCGGRAYIFELDLKNGMQSCTYEVVEKGVSSEKSNLQNLPLDASSWWVRQISANKPIALFSLDEIPEEARYDREVLQAQNIKSVMAVPMISKEGVWGYMGIDIVDSHRKWSNEDYQWFASMANITNICLTLHRSEIDARQDRIFLSNLFKFMPIGYIRLKVLFDADGIPVDYLFVDINGMADKILDIGKFIGQPGGKNNPRMEETIKEIKTVLRTGSYLEVNFRTEDTGKYCHSVIYSPREGEIVCMFTDMTETLKAHEALDRSEKMLRTIYNNLPVGIELYGKDGRLIDFNDRNLEIFGVKDKSEIMHLNLFENIRFSEEIREKLLRLEKLDFSYNYEFSKQQWCPGSQNQGVAHLITKMTPVYDSMNKFVNYLVINIDNTETTSAYRKIQEFEEYFSVIADFAKVGYFKWNPFTEKGFAISQWYKNVGEPDHKNLKDIIGVYGSYHPQDREIMKEFYQRVLQGSAHEMSREIRVKQADGSWSWLRCNTMVREYDPRNEQFELVGVNYDITALKNAEEKLIAAKDKAETMDHLKSSFIANMSHEIRTPLNAIVGFSNLLIDAGKVEEKKQYISIIQDNNRLLLKLISDILDLSKLDAGTFDFVKNEVDIRQLCEEIICFHRVKTEKEIEIRLDEQLPECCIFSDKNRLSQILSNFLNNALKFTNHGSITLGYRLAADREEVEFSVTDTGIGIPKEKQEEIFGRFVKLDNFVNGTGLGLPICKSLAEQLGGKIGVESQVGVGSRFWFTHPCQD